MYYSNEFMKLYENYNKLVTRIKVSFMFCYNNLIYFKYYRSTDEYINYYTSDTPACYLHDVQLILMHIAPIP